MKKQFLALLLAGAPLLAAQANGLLPPDSDLSLVGFGTLGLARSNTDDAQFVRYNQAEGVTTRYGSGTDSNLGLQAGYRIDPALSATVQLLTRKFTSAHYETDLTWAFLKWRASSSVSLRAGRVVLPSFMISDYQNVGYANTMMRPPIELYALAPIENVDGGDLTWQRSFGASTVTAQLAAGVSRGKLYIAGGGGSIAHYRAPLVGLNLALEDGPFTLRASRIRIAMGSDDVSALNTLTARLRTAGFGQLARDLTLVGGKNIDFTSLGLAMDWSNIVLQGEYGWRRAAEPVYIPDNQAWYLMAGYRAGQLLPYYAHAAVHQSGRSVTLPAAFLATGAPARALDMGYLTAGQQHTDLIGLRWNFAKSRALKVQLDRVVPTVKSGDLIFGPPDGLRHPVTVLGLAFDFVF